MATSSVPISLTEYTTIDVTPPVVSGHTVDNDPKDVLKDEQKNEVKEGKINDTTTLPKKSEMRVSSDLLGDLVGNAESDWEWLLTGWEMAIREHAKGCRRIDEFDAYKRYAMETGKSLGDRTLAEWLESACPKAWNNGEWRIKGKTAKEYETEFMQKLAPPYELFYPRKTFTIANQEVPKRPEQVPDEVSLASIMTMIQCLQEKVDALSRPQPRIDKKEEPKEAKEEPKPKVPKLSLKEKMAKLSDRQLLELMFTKVQQNSNRIADLERLRPNSMRSL